MAGIKWKKEEIDYLIDLVKNQKIHPHDCISMLKEAFGVDRTVPSFEKILRIHNVSYADTKKTGIENKDTPKQVWQETKKRDTWIIESADSRITNKDEALRKAGVDTDIWEIEKIIINGWDVTMKLKDGDVEKPFRSQNQALKIFLRRKVPVQVENSIEKVLDRIRNKSPKVKFIKRKIKKNNKSKNSLEICLMDVHYGMRCFPPAAGMNYSPEICREIISDTINQFIELSKPYTPFNEIVLPVGNDFFHTDNVFHTTTAGTNQPESESYLHTFMTGERLMIEIIDILKEIAPIKIYSIPGNHDRTSSFMLGRILKANYHNDKNVYVDASSSPLKSHRFGVNFWAYEHGHSINAIRLAAIMANEWPNDFAEAKFKSWHLGDQHRAGSSKPSMLSEQGVNIEYIPSIVATNEWHKIKGFSNQQRGSVGFIYDYNTGPVCKLYVNVDKETNKVMR